jgi:genome maintenance exonuclease 1
MYKPKYNYKELTREHGNHGRFYNVGGDRPLPSVTTIMSNTSDKEWLREWREAIGEEKAKEIVDESSMIGNGMHDLLEAHYTGIPISYKPPLISNLFADTIVKKGLVKVDEVWGVEAPLYFPDLYAGTTDLVGVHESVPAIMDYKNARQDKTEEDIEDYFLQLVAYGSAHNDVYGTDIRKGVIMMMCRSGRYKEFILQGNKYDSYRKKWFVILEKYYSKFGIQMP